MSASEALDLFSVDVPVLRHEPPVAPGSTTSELAARAIDGPFRSKGLRDVMLCLGGAKHPMSREEICAAIGMRESTACARLADLRPIWVRAIENAGKTSSGRPCDLYTLTEQGRARLSEATGR